MPFPRLMDPITCPVPPSARCHGRDRKTGGKRELTHPPRMVGDRKESIPLTRGIPVNCYLLKLVGKRKTR